jgi:virulence-associated protein VagC
MITKIFKSGNSMAMRLPKELNAREGEISITRQGNRWIVEPVKARKWPKDFFKKIRITDPDFKRPEQGEHRPVEL